MRPSPELHEQSQTDIANMLANLTIAVAKLTEASPAHTAALAGLKEDLLL